MALAAAAAIAAAAAVAVFAAAFALYALLEIYVGPPGAAAIVAAVAALIVAITGLVAARRAEQRAARQPEPTDALGLAEKVVGIVKDRPLLTIGAALAAGVFALKNPTLTAAVAKAFMETRRPPR